MCLFSNLVFALLWLYFTVLAKNGPVGPDCLKAGPASPKIRPGPLFWAWNRVPMATNIDVGLVLWLLSDFQSTKTFSFGNRSPLNFLHTRW